MRAVRPGNLAAEPWRGKDLARIREPVRVDGEPQALEREVGTTGLDFEEAFVEFLHKRGH